VDGVRLPANPEIVSAYRWDPVTRDYATLAGEPLSAGTVVWVKAGTNVVASVQGIYVEPGPASVSGGGTYVSGAGLDTWPLPLREGVTVWRIDAASNRWQPTYTGNLAPVSGVPPKIAPGEAIYVHTSEAVELARPEPAHRIAYYHQDHLGSSSVITDGAGRVAEESAYYPFGATRHRQRSREMDAHYDFLQKERDTESRLHYFEARYLASPLARFISFDPMLKRLETLETDELKNLLAQPTKLNPFVYALNNPMRFVDPDGREARPRTRPAEVRRQRPEGRGQKPEQPQPELTIRLGQPSKQPGEISALAFSIEQKAGAKGAVAGSGGEGRSAFTDFQITRQTDKTSSELFKKSQQGVAIKSVTLIIPGKEGAEFRIHMTDVFITGMNPSSHEGQEMETLTLNAGSVRFGDIDSSPRPSRETWSLDLRTNQ
jgi:RHS repeat-associated protein